MLFYALQYASQHAFDAHRMLPYHFSCEKSITSVKCLVPVIIGAVSLDQ